jgi:adenosylcobinamide kinase/adenosylcobinamide-phosphate guanylyltransferase
VRSPGQEIKKGDSQFRTPISKLIFITGGARSGKSACALKVAGSISGKKAYLATAQSLDKEMDDRIKKHRRDRDDSWTTIEEPLDISDIIKKNTKYNVILLDCLTIWISNLMHKKANGKLEEASIADVKTISKAVYREVDNLINVCRVSNANFIVVSNEVGLGIVPDNPLARWFRDIAGLANQKMAEAADEVHFVVSGITTRIK